jgi:hypothetical protein
MAHLLLFDCVGWMFEVIALDGKHIEKVLVTLLGVAVPCFDDRIRCELERFKRCLSFFY